MTSKRYWQTGIVLSGVLLTSILSFNPTPGLTRVSVTTPATTSGQLAKGTYLQSVVKPVNLQGMLDNNKKVVEVSEPKTNKKTTVVNRQTVVASRSSGSGRGSTADNVIRYALSFRGTPYRWGGTTPAGFDCAGFVQYVFGKFGISLPRTSFEQFRVGTAISRDQLRPGDLVFFQTISRGPSDVRIYMGGGVTIGSSNKGVSVESLSDGYWAKNYYGARRILK